MNDSPSTPTLGAAQFSLVHLFMIVSAAAAVFWLCRLVGATGAILLLGFAANCVVVRVLRCDTMFGGAFWGTLTNAVILLLLTPVLVSQDRDGRNLIIMLYLTPGAWLGAVHAMLRQASDLDDGA